MKNKDNQHVPLTREGRKQLRTILKKPIGPTVQTRLSMKSLFLVAQNSADETIFTLEELKAALKAAKSNKQPGPDGVTMELFK